MGCRSFSLLMVAVVCGMAGCGGNGAPPDRPKVIPARGMVQFNGQPLANATVVFRSTAGQPGATGLTNAEGHFELQTFDPHDGAIPGAYDVIISKYETFSTRPKSGSAGDDAGGDAPEPKPLIPLRYQDPKRSGLAADVIEGGENKFTFDLKG